MTPYYDDGTCTIYHGDCREITAWLGADVLVTDPPYGTRFDDSNPRGGYGRRQNAGVDGTGFVIGNDDTSDVRDEVLSLWGDRPAAVFGSPRRPDPPIAVADRLVWDKKRLGMNGGPWRYRHETIFVTAGFVRVSDAASSIIEICPDHSDHIHAKPVGLMERIVAAAPLGAAADPFAGSGSTLLAARNLGRRAIGVEIEERYCEIAAKRLAQEVLDLSAVS